MDLLTKRFSLFAVLLIMSTQPLTAQQPQKPETVNYQQAVTLFQKGLYERSAEEFKNFISSHPDHPLTSSANFYYVRALSRSNPDHKASYYQRYIHLQPNSVFAQKLLFDLAYTARKSKNYDEAMRYYKQVISHNVTNKQKTRAYYWMAETAANIGNLNSARRYFQQIYDEFPESEWAPKALYSKGRLYLKNQQFSKASQTFELLKKSYPNKKISRRVSTALGEAYYKQGKYKQAIEALQESLVYLKDDQKKKAVLLIAESYNALGELDKASKTYRRYINLTEGTSAERAAHYGLGWVFYKREIYHWAADEFAKAATGNDLMARKALYYKAVNEKLAGRYKQSLKTFRNFSDKYKSGRWFEKSYYEHAVTAYEMGRYGEAIQQLLYLIRSDEKLKWKGKIYTLLGQAYFANNEYSRALQAYKAADKLGDIPDEVERQAHFQKAWLMFSSEAYDNAQKIFERLYQKAPETKIGKKSLFWNADSYFNLDQFGAAANYFNTFVQKYPNHELAGAAFYSLGWTYFQMGEFAKAIAPFKRFLNDYEPPKVALFPYDVDARLRLGDTYYALSNYKKAIQTYRQLVGNDTGGDYALFQIGNSYYRAEQNYRAVTTFRKLLDKYPNSPLREQTQYNIAYIYLNSGNYEQAIAELKKVISQYPGTSWAALAQYNIGDAYYNSGHYKKAITAYKNVLQNYPESEYVIEAANAIDYAKAAENTGGNTKSTNKSALATFIENNPDAAKGAALRYKRAKQLLQTGDYINAAQKLEKIVANADINKILPEAYVDLGRAYYQMNKTGKAIEAYQKVVQQYSESEAAATALTKLGDIKYGQAKYQAAIDYYNRVITTKSSHQLEAQVGWANTLLALGNLKEAKKHYKAALSMDASYAPAKNGLARIALQQNNGSDAIELLTAVSQSNTAAAGAEAQYLLGKVQQKRGNFTKALDTYSKVQVLYKHFDSWVAKSIMGSAESYIQMGNRSKAQKLLKELINQYPSTNAAVKAQQMLEE